MLWAEGFIAVDWGTTNRRAYLLAADGRLLDEMADDCGVLSVRTGGFPDAVAAVTARLGDRPMLMAGMVGSNRGWREAPYVPCPAGLPELAQRIHWIEDGRIGIVPGISFVGDGRADVMRGEEVQILGAYGDGLIGGDATICHPGTHNKWIRMEDGRLAAFRTVMTGEIFNLLRRHSILADLLDGPAEAVSDAFQAGVRHGLDEDDLTAELFSIRARVLLGKARREDAASYASGLLIGSDVRTGLRGAGDGDIVVIGAPELTSLFCAALAIAGRPAREIDGETAFLAGARHLAELVQ
jgi:2-dehydro-3-deoxygalactonokinase